MVTPACSLLRHRRQKNDKYADCNSRRLGVSTDAVKECKLPFSCSFVEGKSSMKETQMQNSKRQTSSLICLNK